MEQFCTPVINDDLEITKEDVEQLKEFITYVGREGFDTLNERGGFRKSMKMIRLMEGMYRLLEKWTTYVPDDDGAEELESDQPALK